MKSGLMRKVERPEVVIPPEFNDDEDAFHDSICDSIEENDRLNPWSRVMATPIVAVTPHPDGGWAISFEWDGCDVHEWDDYHATDILDTTFTARAACAALDRWIATLPDFIYVPPN